jgi:hypothetical protein
MYLHSETGFVRGYSGNITAGEGEGPTSSVVVRRIRTNYMKLVKVFLKEKQNADKKKQTLSPLQERAFKQAMDYNKLVNHAAKRVKTTDAQQMKKRPPSPPPPQDDFLPQLQQQCEYIPAPPATKRPRVVGTSILPIAEDEIVDAPTGTTAYTDTDAVALPDDDVAVSVAPSIARDDSVSGGGGGASSIRGLDTTTPNKSCLPTDRTKPKVAADQHALSSSTPPMNQENSGIVQQIASRGGDETMASTTTENDSPPATTTATAMEKEAPAVPAPEKKKKKKAEQKYKKEHDLTYGVEIHKSIPPVAGEVLEKVSEVICRFCIKKGAERPKIFKLPLRTDKYSDHHGGKKHEYGAHEQEWEDYQKLDYPARVNFWKEQDGTEATKTAAVAPAIVDKPKPPLTAKSKYQGEHGRKFGLRVLEVNRAGTVVKAVCMFCEKDGAEQPKIYDEKHLKTTTYRNHLRGKHGKEWKLYDELVKEDDITNYFAEAAEPEEAVMEVTKVA